MSDWKQRVFNERDELLARYNNLSLFIEHVHAGIQVKIMDDYHFELLERQLNIMKAYLDILNTRIGSFTEK